MNLFSKRCEITGHAGAVYSCCYHDNLIYSGSVDKYVARWKLDEGIQDKFAIAFEYPVYSVKLVNDNLFVGLNNGHVHVFDLSTKKEIKFFTQHNVGIFCIQYNPIMSQVYIADADGNLSVWNSETFELEIYLPLDCGKIRNIDVRGDGNEIVLGAQDGTVRIFDTETFNEKLKWTGHKGGTTSVLFHPEKEGILLTGGKDAMLREWKRGEEYPVRSIPAHNYAIYDLLYLGNNVLASCSRDKTIKIWDADSLNFIERLDVKSGGHKHSVNDLEKVGENQFISCSDDGKIIVWKK